MPRRTKKEITFDELLNNVSKLSKSELNKLVNNYLKVNGGKVNNKYNKAVLLDLEEHIKELNINDKCPACNSSIIVANGRRENGVQRLKCSECGKTFTYFTGTMLEKTKYHWDLWIEVIFLMLANKSIVDIQRVLIDDKHCIGIAKSTVENWRYKILKACEALPQPVLSGVVEIDETHYHESQKGVKAVNMVKVFPGIDREARYCYKAAKYGPMGSEFATIITAIDKTGHCVCKVSGLGKFDTERFTELFEPHFNEVQWICSDFNAVYGKYCDRKNIQHYVRPSDFVNLVVGKSKEELEQLYNDRKLDFIEHESHTYSEMVKLRKTYGLNLDKVNELHGELRALLNTANRGTSTRHLSDWVAWYSLLKNFTADYGHKPASRKDAEEIFKMLLKTKSNLLLEDMLHKKLDLPKPSDKDLLRLKDNTDKSRALSGRKKFVFTEEDLIEGGSVKKILNEMPLSKLKEITKYYASKNKRRYKGYTSYLNKGMRYKYIQLLDKEPDIKDVMLMIIGKTGKDVITSNENPNLVSMLAYVEQLNDLDEDN